MSKKYKGLDKLFSEFIRKRAIKSGGCERCHTAKTDYKLLHCSHFHGRRKISVRFDESNASGLCPGCHRYLDGQPLLHCEWKREQLGDKEYDNLNLRARMPNKPDINLLTIYYRQQIKNVERNGRW